MKAVQPPTHRCEDCRADVPVQRQASGYEFEWVCPKGHAGVISWAHVNPPPVFVGEPVQVELFA